MTNFLELTGQNVQDLRELNGHMVTVISLLVIQILVIFAVGAAIVSQIAKLTSSVDAAIAAIGNSANQTPDADVLAQAQRLDDSVAATGTNPTPAPPAPQPPVAE